MNDVSGSYSQVGFDEARVDVVAETPDNIIYQSWMSYLKKTLGRSESFAHQRAMADVTRSRAKGFVDSLKKSGWPIEGMTVLDLGSGHGTLAVELAASGAIVTAVEPCDAWREVAERRTAELGLQVQHVGADGASLPFKDGSFDAVVSLQVLEHVKSPQSVIAEMARVVKPGGRFFVSCENYLAFREQHYGVFWFPLLPRWIGALYLRARGRNPEFLLKHVTYTTWPRLLRDFIDSGLIANEWVSVLNVTPEEMTWKSWCFYAPAKLVVGERRARRLLVLARNHRKIFGVGFRASGVRY